MNETTNPISFEDIRSTLRHHRDSSGRQPRSYRVDSIRASQYFRGNPTYEKEVLRYFQKLKGRGIPIVHLDICGRATIQSLGGNMSYCFTQNDDSEFDRQGNRIIQGDLFNGKDFNRFLKEVTSHPEAPALITFRPIVGLFNNDPELINYKENIREVTEEILEKRFGQCADVLRRWGYMYLEQPFQTCGMADFFRRIPQEESQLSLRIKGLAEKHHLNVKIEGSIHGPKFLLRKRRN
jgi:hypothetical protein